MNVLYSTHTSPDYMPPLIISERQIIVGLSYPNSSEGGLVRSINVMRGRYDLAALLSSLPDTQMPDLTVVLADAYQDCVPENLAAVPGRKVLLVADTHHGQNPLQKMLAYARQEPFDRIIVTHDPHHLHWLAEANIAPTKYIPNINCAHFPQPFVENRNPAIVFVGNAEQWHPRRRYLLQAIQKAGLPLVVRQAPAPTAAAMYGSFQIAFNCSLNGDLNMRVFEVMAAGGFLVTDRLSPQSNLESMFSRGRDYVDYETLDELLGVLRYYLAHPRACLKIAKAGQDAYLKAHTPQQRVRDLLEFALEDSMTSTSNHDRRAQPEIVGFGENLNERAQIYECFQELSLKNEMIVVVADAAVGARAISDLVDLPRLKVQVRRFADGSSHVNGSLDELTAPKQVEYVEGRFSRCDIQLMDARTILSLHDASCLSAQWVAVMSAGSSMDRPTEWLASHGFSKVREAPWLFRKSSGE